MVEFWMHILKSVLVINVYVVAEGELFGGYVQGGGVRIPVAVQCMRNKQIANEISVHACSDNIIMTTTTTNRRMDGQYISAGMAGTLGSRVRVGFVHAASESLWRWRHSDDAVQLMCLCLFNRSTNTCHGTRNVWLSLWTFRGGSSVTQTHTACVKHFWSNKRSSSSVHEARRHPHGADANLPSPAWWAMFDGQCGTGFVANFLENTTVKNFENRPIYVKVTNECIVAQFFWLTVY